MANSGIPPWHMWGNTQVIGNLVAGGGAAASQRVQQQLIRVGYKRPETWHWCFSAKLISGPDFGPGGVGTVLVNFDLTIGVGRSMVILPAFESYLFAWNGIAAPINRLKYSTSVFGPNRIDDPNVLETRDNFIDQITAEDIQLGCTIAHQSTTAGTVASVEVSAHFAPKTHLRPSWFREPAQFHGGEG